MPAIADESESSEWTGQPTLVAGTSRYDHGEWIYNDFVFRTPFPATEILADLEHEKILGGLPLKLFFKDQPNDFLVAVTELNTREQLDALAAALSAAISRERR